MCETLEYSGEVMISTRDHAEPAEKYGSANKVGAMSWLTFKTSESPWEFGLTLNGLKISSVWREFEPSRFPEVLS